MPFFPFKRIEWIASVAAGIETNRPNGWGPEQVVARATKIVDLICTQENEHGEVYPLVDPEHDVNLDLLARKKDK